MHNVYNKVYSDTISDLFSRVKVNHLHNIRLSNTHFILSCVCLNVVKHFITFTGNQRCTIYIKKVINN